jgi:hypothetical protein
MQCVQNNTNISYIRVNDKIINLIDTKSPILNLEKLNIRTSDILSQNNPFYVRSLTRNEKIEDSVKNYIKNKKGGSKLLLELLGLSIKDIFMEDMFTPTIYNIFGCPLSTDIDIAIIVPQIVDPVFIDMSIIMKQLEPNNRELDITQIVLDKRGNFSLSSKGSKETQNMLYYTYEYHKQTCPPIFTKPIDHIELIDKINAVSKYILDNIEDFIGNDKYLKFRDTKKIIYNQKINRLEYTNNILATFHINELNSVIKSTCVKIFQTIVTFKTMDRIAYIYSKTDLANEIANLYNLNYENIIALITRGKYGLSDLIEINKIFKFIVNEYLVMSNEILEHFVFLLNDDCTIPFNPKPTNVLFIEFLKSPFKPTDTFIQEIQRVNPERNLNIQNYIINSNYDEVKEYLDYDFIKNHCELDSQRTDKWLELMNFYRTGKNNGIVPFNGTTYTEWITHYYNLIRGCSSEILISEFCDFSQALKLDLVKFNCGLLVEKKEKAARACAPDLLLIEKKSKKIIPVEMKAMVGKPEYSANFAREIKLARLQLSTSKKLLNEFYYGFSLIVIMFMYEENGLKYDIRYHILDP